MDSRIKPIVGLIAQLIVGAVFIASSVLKLLAIESIDLFVYEHQFLPWHMTTFATRFLVGLEFLIGSFLLLNIVPRISRRLSMIFVVGFMVYLFVKPLIFDLTIENCHCFGDQFEMGRTASLIKNGVLLLLLFLSSWRPLSKIPFAKFIAIGLACCSLIMPVVLNPPDIILHAIHKEKTLIDPSKFQEMLEDESLQPLRLQEGRQIICMYSTGCHYCKMMVRRMDVVIRGNHLDIDRIKCIFWGAESAMEDFFSFTQSPCPEYRFISPFLFLAATKGKQPVVVLVENGIAVKAFGYTSFDEKAIIRFLNGDS